VKSLLPFLIVVALFLLKRIFFPGYERSKWKIIRRVLGGFLFVYWIYGMVGSIYMIHRVRRIALLSIDACDTLSVTSPQLDDLRKTVIYLDHRNWMTSALFPLSHRQTLRALNLMYLVFGIDHWTQKDYQEWMRLSQSTTRSDWEALDRRAHENLKR
jgi:hypothetical protein